MVDVGVYTMKSVVVSTMMLMEPPGDQDQEPRGVRQPGGGPLQVPQCCLNRKLDLTTFIQAAAAVGESGEFNNMGRGLVLKYGAHFITLHYSAH